MLAMTFLNHWHTSAPTLPECPSGMTTLMEIQTSLTAALHQLDAEFSLQLLYLGETGFDQLFGGDGVSAFTVDSASSSVFFARDVLLCLDNIPVVWARSFCRADAHAWHKVLNCGTRPLGEILFNDSFPLSRSAFEYARLSPNTPLAGYDGGAVSARRSAFSLEVNHLGLIEAFLPALCTFITD